MRSHMRARAPRSPVHSPIRGPARSPPPRPAGHHAAYPNQQGHREPHGADRDHSPPSKYVVHARQNPKEPQRSEDLLLAAETGVSVPSGMERCRVVGGGFSGTGEEFGLMRIRTPRPERTAMEHHAMPCSIYPWGEVGILRLPQQQESSPDVSLEGVPRADWKKRMAEEAEQQRLEYQAEVESRLRSMLEEKEKKRFAENSQNLASLFNRLGAKWESIQEEKIAQRRREVAAARFELHKHEMRKREQAAAKIQSWWRMILQLRIYRVILLTHRKKQMEKRLHVHMKRQRVRAAVHIQRVWRGWVVRVRYREKRTMMREDWLARRLRKYLKEKMQRANLRKEAAKRNKWVIYSVRAVVRIQSWYRGWKARQEIKRARLLRLRENCGEATDLERLRRIRREAVHTSTELSDHKDMTMVQRALKRRDIEDQERLTRDLRKVRDVARKVEADLVRDAELEVVPLKELSDFLEAKRLRADRDEARLEADAQGSAALHVATIRERELQDKMDMKEVTFDLAKVRQEAKWIQKSMVELQDGAAIFSRIQDYRREADIRA